MQKRPHFVFQRNKVFSILLFKISHAEDKDFYLGRDRSKLREQELFLQNLFSVFEVIFSILPSLSIPPHFLSQKLKIRRLKKRKEERKLRRKRGRTSFDFFQLLPCFFSQIRNLKRKKRRKFSFLFLSHFLLQNRKKEWKEGEKKQKKRKKRRKRKGDLFFLSPLPKRKEEEKRGKWSFFLPPERKENGKREGRKYVSTRPWKRKRPCFVFRRNKV